MIDAYEHLAVQPLEQEQQCLDGDVERASEGAGALVLVSNLQAHLAAKGNVRRLPDEAEKLKKAKTLRSLGSIDRVRMAWCVGALDRRALARSL
jgi:hypothetical protein